MAVRFFLGSTLFWFWFCCFALGRQNQLPMRLFWFCRFALDRQSLLPYSCFTCTIFSIPHSCPIRIAQPHDARRTRETTIKKTYEYIAHTKQTTFKCLESCTGAITIITRSSIILIITVIFINIFRGGDIFLGLGTILP